MEDITLLKMKAEGTKPLDLKHLSAVFIKKYMSFCCYHTSLSQGWYPSILCTDIQKTPIYWK